MTSPDTEPTTRAAHVVLPNERGGWWHEYVCPVHGTELLHDDMLGGTFPPAGVRCPHGCLLDTPAIRGAWTVLAHQACAVRIRDLALAGPDHDQQVLDVLTQWAELYAGLDSDHEGSQAWMLRGRLFHQALTEAIWAVHIGRACWALRDREVVLPTQVDALLTGLVEAAATARETLLGQGRFTSNFVAWLDAAGAVCSRDEGWLTGDHGTYAHLRAAVLPDGWQWEASTYYHSFVLRACLVAIDGVPGAVVPDDVAERLAAMRRVLQDLRTGSGELPALHDGPYRRPGYDAELAELDLAADLPAGPATSVVVQPDGGYAVLRRPGLQAVVAFGPHGSSHGHFDTLSLLLYGDRSPFQADPGQVPYGHRYWRTHYASTTAHPTFSIDGHDQEAGPGELISHDDTSVVVASALAYPGVHATRSLRLTDAGLVDELTVRCDRPHRIALHLRPVGGFRVTHHPNGVTTHWAGDGEHLVGEHEVTAPAEVLLRPGPGPADDPQRGVPHLDWVAVDSTDVTFRSTYRVVDGADATHR
ncbi:heparinase II/III domain-containing protein [Propionibacteriaceae bacterium Y2011]